MEREGEKYGGTIIGGESERKKGERGEGGREEGRKGEIFVFFSGVMLDCAIFSPHDSYGVRIIVSYKFTLNYVVCKFFFFSFIFLLFILSFLVCA